MRTAFLRLLAVSLTATATATAAAPSAMTPVPTLVAGPYEVGFRSSDLYDYTRTYLAPVTVTGAEETRERARPMQTSVWYPAVPGSGEPMKVVDYIELGAHREGATVTVDRSRAYISGYFTDLESRGWKKKDAEAIAATAVHAKLNASVAPGRFPVIVYNAGGGCPSWDNAVLFEQLASHGYVVIASPDIWNWDVFKEEPPDLEPLVSAEASTRDIEFHIGYARSLPFADSKRLGVMGYSWGGQAAVMAALRNRAVGAVVSLDGSEIMYGPAYARSAHANVARLQASYLVINSGIERTVQYVSLHNEPALSGQYLQRWRHLLANPPVYAGMRDADAYQVVLKRFFHSNFSSEWIMWERNDQRKPGEPGVEEDWRNYATLAEYILNFLNGYLKDDGSARRWLQSRPSASEAEPENLQVVFKAARPGPAPTVDGFAKYAHEHGFEALKARVDELRRADGEYRLLKEDALLWASQLEQARQPRLALMVRGWTKEWYPD